MFFAVDSYCREAWCVENPLLERNEKNVIDAIARVASKADEFLKDGDPGFIVVRNRLNIVHVRRTGKCVEGF